MKETKDKSKVNPVDGFFIKLIEEHIYEIAIALLVLLSVLIRIKLTFFKFGGEYISGDYNGFLKVWVDLYRENGIAGGLKQIIGDYYVPYNLILAVISVIPVFDEGIWISVVSVAGEYLGALFMYKILLLLNNGGKRRAAFSAAMMLYLPAAILNGTLWKQCDALYTGIILVGLYFMLKKSYTAAFAFLSLAFAFKLQTLFVVPFILVLYILYHEFSIFQFLWFPGMYLVTGLPAIICKRSVYDTYATYFKQSVIHKMTVGFPNIYCLGIDSYEAMTFPALMITIAVLIITACFLKAKEKYLDEKLLFAVAGFMTMTCPMFLPGMHQRYDYLAILILTMYALCIDLYMAPAAVIMNICPIFTYGSYLFHNGDNLISYQTMALMYLFAYLYAAGYIYAIIRRKMKKKAS